MVGGSGRGSRTRDIGARGGADVEVGGAGGMTWTVHCDRGTRLRLRLQRSASRAEIKKRNDVSGTLVEKMQHCTSLSQWSHAAAMIGSNEASSSSDMCSVRRRCCLSSGAQENDKSSVDANVCPGVV